ncbi:EutN/CcmL family microcompartment protein [Fusibacter sp. JL298sf-3]
MFIGKVIGNVWATRKEQSLNGLKMLVIKPVNHHAGASRPEVVAADAVGAGVGDVVLVATGSSARRALDRKDSSVDATVVGIVDEVEVNAQLDD